MRYLIIGIQSLAASNPVLQVLSVCTSIEIQLGMSHISACVLRVMASPKTGWRRYLVRSITSSLLCMHHQTESELKSRTYPVTYTIWVSI